MRRWLISFCFLFCAILPATAQETIANFISDVTVNTDGSLDVRETITVNAEGASIRRGILRDFPTDYIDKNGLRVRAGFDVLSVRRDGKAEPFAVESISKGKRIRIGSADVLLNRGQHTYQITYHTTRQLGFFDGFDELYWNATGNGWTFPIDNASVIIRLPAGADLSQYSVYTGHEGEKGTEARVTRAHGTQFAAEMSRQLAPGEGLTVAVAWQKGIVAAPTAAEKRANLISDNLGIGVLGLTLLLVPFYFLFAWLKVGRDPPKGTIVPLFHPPEGMGPAGARYVWEAGYDNTAFAAAVVGLAVKGRLTIRQNDDGTYTLARDQRLNTALLASEEALLRALPERPLTLRQSNHVSVSALSDALSESLDAEYDGVMYLKNLKWFVGGLALSILGVVIAALLLPSADGGLMLLLGGFTSVWWTIILVFGYHMVKGLFSGGGLASKLTGIFGILFLVPFVGAGIAVPSAAALLADVSSSAKWLLAAGVVLLSCNVVFYWLLKAPTRKGRAVLDQLEGFRLYLSTAEEERLKILHPPEQTPELFERYLPYAMALGCENAWNAKFVTVLAAAAAAGTAATGVGLWYHGNQPFSAGSMGGLTNNLGASLASAVAASDHAPGSSSGSSGGGSSGGGGGGGGGSGW